MAEIEKPDTPTNVVNVKNLTDQQLYDEFVNYSKTVLEAEKFGDLTPELLNIQQTQDWETFSRARGYTEQEISDFKRYLDLSAEMENRFPGKDGFASLAEGINYELQHENSITTLEEWKKFNSTDTPTNVVDDKLSTFDTTLNSADGNVEFYIKHQGTQVSANDIRYNPNLGSDTEKFIPGFYGEPVGDVSAKTMGIKIQDNPVSNYYKVQVNTNNLLITQPDGFLGNQIDKVDWNIFAKETGISLSDIKNPKTQNVNSLINQLKQLGLDDGTIAEGFRKSGIEGFVELKGDWREVVLIDPNDDLGIGSKLNIEDTTEVEFLNNQSKVNQIDELVIKPTNVVDDIKLTDTPGGSLGAANLNDPLVFDSWIDNYAKTTTSFIDNLPLETIVKNRVKNLIAKKSAQAATPGGPMDAVDFWEFSVLGLMAAAVAFKEYDEIPTILTNKAVDMFNSMTSFYGIPPVQKIEYDLDYEYITKVLDTGEKFMPTDIIINKGVEEFKEGQEAGIDISAGLGAQAGVFNNSITTPAKTDTMETTQKIQPGVQENKIFEQAIKKENIKKSMKTQYQSQVPKEAGSFEEVILKSKEKTKPKKIKSGGGGSGVKIL